MILLLQVHTYKGGHCCFLIHIDSKFSSILILSPTSSNKKTMHLFHIMKKIKSQLRIIVGMEKEKCNPEISEQIIIYNKESLV